MRTCRSALDQRHHGVGFSRHDSAAERARDHARRRESRGVGCPRLAWDVARERFLRRARPTGARAWCTGLGDGCAGAPESAATQPECTGRADEPVAQDPLAARCGAACQDHGEVARSGRMRDATLRRAIARCSRMGQASSSAPCCRLVRRGRPGAIHDRRGRRARPDATQ